MTEPTDIRFPSGGVQCAAWHHVGEGDALSSPAGRPCVVMAHGFAATRDSGLPPFAQAFAAAGADVVLFDYRHFGASDGEPRQLLSPRRQREDYAAAIAYARTLPGVDPDRIVAWGVSFAGGHVLQVAAEDPRIAAVIALTPATDGLATLVDLVRRNGPLAAGRLTAVGLKDALRALRGAAPVYAPSVGAPGTVAALTAPGAEAAMHAVAGPTWRNEVAARIFLQVGSYAPGRHAAKLRVPLLVQIGDEDRTVTPAQSMKAAEKGRAEVRHYPCDHFDVYPGGSAHERVVEHQLAFLRRHLGGGAAAATAPVGAAA
ncbi:alpha/beta hydrolase [Paraconexibacter algicola]|uniref:Alpha/beta hydrolase n=1 Tax=Paraconexibacter algicola TaxID=2133960 RepID=A0A2T4UGR1_9ACTN|nr:alpha/beta hydrolase [Paraconexibacter algicola]PTL58420.1 alpha/beta hydrolase [Paraconexibacter algicola]